MIKKRIAALAAALVIASSGAVVFAGDYNENKGGVPSTSGPKLPSGTVGGLITPIVSTSDSTGSKDDVDYTVITEERVKNADEKGTSIKIPTGGASFTKGAMSALATASGPVKFQAVSGNYSYSIDPSSVKGTKGINIGFEIIRNDDTNEVTIIPLGWTGSFGCTINLRVNKVFVPDGLDLTKANNYHITDDGKITNEGPVTANSDGTFTVALSSASYYVVSAGSAEDVAAGAGVDGNGSVL
ncbi:MAG: hypothetical protein IJ149_02590 [Oscillospiraceae bacterium]|nr:hypothetical protein [Oscillospiraceae bacterium]